MLLLAGVMLSGGSAFAHASLLRAEPTDGSMLASAPLLFVLTFSEPVSPLVLRLAGPDGSLMTLDSPGARDAILRVEAPAAMENGTYVLNWRVISQDGHPVAGGILFSIGAQTPGMSASAVDIVNWPVRGAIWTTRLVIYAGIFMGIGGAFFASWIGGVSRPAVRSSAGLMIAALLALPLSVGFQGLDALGATLRNLNEPLVWRAGFSTSYGTTVQFALGAIGLGLLSLVRHGIASRLLSLAALAVAGFAFTTSGHASTADPQWLTRPAVFLHVVGIAFWAGALIPLHGALRVRTLDAVVCLRRFSLAAPFAVMPLVAAGLLLSLIQLGRLDALWATAYGALLLAKLALLAALFALALVNRLWLTAPAERMEPAAVRHLRRSIRAEVILILAIFAVAAGWRFTPPPRALAAAAAEPASVYIHSADAMVDLMITPGRVGPVSASMIIMTGDFGPLDAKAVTLVLANPVAGIGALSLPATKPGEGTWRVEDLRLMCPGRWIVRVDIIDREEKTRALDGMIEIRP
ncbi:copper resistance CopC/CopD family protein [Ancylobacter lacus]|uniref:copper resistance CopC/CopD family protein n=1 Tax=Ancylobacter lacus TaxID=2579970 RepID=UPI001FE5F6B0|nr:CopD family protein [Ancylobacter lacus]